VKVSLIGIGKVGSTIAYTLLMRGLADQLVLVDRDSRVAEGEALDLQHAEAFTAHPVQVIPGNIPETADSDVLILGCSVPWKSSYTSRFDIGRENLKLFQDIVPQLARLSPKAKILVISNPVDVMTWHTIELSGFDPARVFGTGTLIDSARFRTMLSAQMGIHPDDLRAYILGEHGDSQFPVFSQALAGATPITKSKTTNDIFLRASRAGFDVVNRKGHTNYAISLATALIIEAIAWDTRRTIPLSVKLDGFLGINDVCLSLPAVLGRSGITQVLKPELGPSEKESLLGCAEVVRQGIKLSKAAAK
jgi:L-lactate dehydrogenase